MRFPAGVSVVVGAIAFVAISSLPRAEFLRGTGPRAFAPALLKALKRDRCAVLAVALGGRPGVCEKFRAKNGDLPVRMVAMDGEKEIELVKGGDRCPGGYVGADERPRPGAAATEFLDITLTAFDENAAAFQGYSASSKGVLAGCGPAVEGRVRFSERSWRLVGARKEGCPR